MEDLKAQLKEVEAELQTNDEWFAACGGMHSSAGVILRSKIASLEKQSAASSEVTYSVGDRFKVVEAGDSVEVGEKLLLIRCGHNEVLLVGLIDGQYLTHPKDVNDDEKITQKELLECFGDKPLDAGRYWDNSKQCKV